MSQSIMKGMRNCAVCNYWTGNRQVDSFGQRVTVDSSSAKGKCVVQGGLYKGLAVCRALACQVLQLTVFPLFYGLVLGRGGNTKTPKISLLRLVAPESPTAC